MKSVDFVYDMRSTISVVTNRDQLAVWNKIGYNPNSFRFEDDHCYYFPIRSLKAGHVLYAEDWNSMVFYKVRLVHKYANMHFFKWLEGPNAGQVLSVSPDTLFFMRELYPIKVVIPEGITMTSQCERMEIINDYDGPVVRGDRPKNGQ